VLLAAPSVHAKGAKIAKAREEQQRQNIFLLLFFAPFAFSADFA
jgi:hypothetical protein